MLAAIGKIESDHGRSPLPGVTTGHNEAGAGGPMQLLAPTFATILARHRLPPGGARPPSRYDPADAVHAAAFYLCDHGAPTDPPAAIFAYNHSATYVTAVLTQAARYRQTGAAPHPLATEQATVPDPSGTGGHVTPRTAALYHALAASVRLREGATCWDPHPQNPDSDHPRGKACDLFFRPARPHRRRPWLEPSPAGSPPTRPTTACTMSSGKDSSGPPSTPPGRPTDHRSTAARTRPTLTGCHYNHIHFSAY